MGKKLDDLRIGFGNSIYFHFDSQTHPNSLWELRCLILVLGDEFDVGGESEHSRDYDFPRCGGKRRDLATLFLRIGFGELSCEESSTVLSEAERSDDRQRSANRDGVVRVLLYDLEHDCPFGCRVVIGAVKSATNPEGA